MALPEITLPDGTPAFSADAHSIEPGKLYADVRVRTGHDRRRRVYTTVPRTVSVKLDLTNEQALAFYDWYEGPLNAGKEWFSAQVANQGPGLKWWKAQFVEPYVASAQEAGQGFWITAKLLLVGEGTASAPYTPNLSAAVSVIFNSSAVLSIPVSLSASVTVELLAADQSLSSAVTVTMSTLRDKVLRESSGYLLREDGSYVLRE